MCMHVPVHIPPLGRWQRLFRKNGMTLVLKDRMGRALLLIKIKQFTELLCALLIVCLYRCRVGKGFQPQVVIKSKK